MNAHTRPSTSPHTLTASLASLTHVQRHVVCVYAGMRRQRNQHMLIAGLIALMVFAGYWICLMAVPPAMAADPLVGMVAKINVVGTILAMSAVALWTWTDAVMRRRLLAMHVPESTLRLVYTLNQRDLGKLFELSAK